MLSSIFAQEVKDEIHRARTKHPKPQSSRHEGYAILLEEVMEVQDVVFNDKPLADLRKELIQVAAMAQRMAEDLKL